MSSSSTPSTQPTLKVAIAGLGRMGARHALHFHNLTPRATLTAITSPQQHELDHITRTLSPSIRTYLSFTAMLAAEIPLGLQAVVISSATTAHAEQAIEAINAGLHVLCEKPLSTSVAVSRSVCAAYRASQRKAGRSKQKVMCGFSRRFDASYRDAHAKMKSGLIGRPSVMRSQTCDKLDPSGFFVAYAEFSGGIFVDCSIHDVDLALWFFGEDSQVKSVAAVGITAVSPELRRHNDRDNAVGIVEFYGGRIAQLFASRMMAAGQEDVTEITGTEGKLAVNAAPQANLVNVYENTGIRREIPADYYGRFREAFIVEANEFTACCLDDTEVPVRLEGAVKAVEIGCALQEALITGKKVEFDELGRRTTLEERDALMGRAKL